MEARILESGLRPSEPPAWNLPPSLQVGKPKLTSSRKPSLPTLIHSVLSSSPTPDVPAVSISVRNVLASLCFTVRLGPPHGACCDGMGTPESIGEYFLSQHLTSVRASGMKAEGPAREESCS